MGILSGIIDCVATEVSDVVETIDGLIDSPDEYRRKKLQKMKEKKDEEILLKMLEKGK